MGTPAKIASSMAGRPSGVPGILMYRLGRSARPWRPFAAATVPRGVVGQQRRYLEGRPAVDARRAVPDGTKEVGRTRQVFERQVEEELFGGLAPLRSPDGRVVGGALADGVVEDGGVRGEPRDGQLVDVASERAALEKVTGDVVEPETLAEVVELSGGLGWGHDCLAGELRVDPDLCKCGSRTSTLGALAGFEARGFGCWRRRPGRAGGPIAPSGSSLSREASSVGRRPGVRDTDVPLPRPRHRGLDESASSHRTSRHDPAGPAAGVLAGRARRDGGHRRCPEGERARHPGSPEPRSGPRSTTTRRSTWISSPSAPRRRGAT